MLCVRILSWIKPDSWMYSYIKKMPWPINYILPCSMQLSCHCPDKKSNLLLLLQKLNSTASSGGYKKLKSLCSLRENASVL